MDADHFEQLLLLFKNFELNGARDESQNRILKSILAGLRPLDMERLSGKHGIEPAFKEPLKKNLTGGSDDHSSLNIACKYTEVNAARTLKDFLEGVAKGESLPCGNEATPLTMAYNLLIVSRISFTERNSPWIAMFTKTSLCVSWTIFSAVAIINPV
jgi:hypothetical protein